MNALSYAFLGPLVAAAARALSGKPCDRFGGARITLGVFVAMALGTLGIQCAIGIKDEPTGFPVIMRKEVARLEADLTGADLVKQSDKGAAAIIGFTSAIAAFGAFFIPKALRNNRRVNARRDSSPPSLPGLARLSTSSLAADCKDVDGVAKPRHGDLERTVPERNSFIPWRTSRVSGHRSAATRGPEVALYDFLGFYLSCIAITWWCYTRRGGLLFDVERRPPRVGPRGVSTAS